MPRPDIRTLTGEAVRPWLPDLQRLRAVVFRDFPYLYDGDPAAPVGRAAMFAEVPGAAVVFAFADGRPVGAATCLPLMAESANVQAPFLAAGLDPTRFFYFGESVLEQAWRGQGIGHAFFDGREAQARAQGADFAAFCSVERAADHPARPADYRPHDAFWRGRGYLPHPTLACTMEWTDVGDAGPSPHVLRFWLRSLTGAVLP
jgi:GNAT superfamily N-acetyltransferase